MASPPAESAGLRIIRINSSDISPLEATPLPGIRVGDREGNGYVFRRALDGQLVFAPDADFTGITTFSYTVADAKGDVAVVIASVSVRPVAESAADISFTDGSHSASVIEGVDAAIVGSLAIAGMDAGDSPVLHVYEGEPGTPSQRFVVSGDKLHTVEPLDHTTDGVVHLRIVAEDAARGYASSEFAIEVHPAPAVQSPSAETGGAAAHKGPALAYSSAQPMLEAAAALQQFIFTPDSDVIAQSAEPIAQIELSNDGAEEAVAVDIAGIMQEGVSCRPAVTGDDGNHQLPPVDPGDFSGF